MPRSLPALLRAHRVGAKAAHAGFDWPGLEGPLDKVEEEFRELRRALETGDRGAASGELGDLLFALVNVARKLELDPEQALLSTVDRFVRRFRYVERRLGKPLEEASLEEMDRLWEEAKAGTPAGSEGAPGGGGPS